MTTECERADSPTFGSAIVWRPCGKELQQTGRENRLPDNRAASPHKDGCKSRFYKQLRLASFHAR